MKTSRIQSVTAMLHPATARMRAGSILLMTLLIMVLMTIVVVAFLGAMTWEASASRHDYEKQRAQAMVTLGMNTAVSQIRYALGPWDNPFVNFTNAAPPYYWSISPGLLTRWSYTNTAPLANYALFSMDPNGGTNVVDLNAQSGDGTYPIAGGATAPNISVYWVNVMNSPGSAASVSNPITGRYAFWVDDENAKLNINTADGSQKYTRYSLGLGTPSEMSLQVLQSGGNNISTATATNIVYMARTTGFNSPREILRVAGATPDLYTNNAFNITTWGRSPELNIFGEPKINMITLSPPTTAYLVHGGLETNYITGMPPTEIYPTPAQLHPFSIVEPYTRLTYSDGWMPLAFSQEWTMEGNARNIHGLQGDRETWMTLLISRYLGGTNSVGLPITWPEFAGAANTNGFLGKYSARQLDTLAAQITDVAGKALSPEADNLEGPSAGDYQMPFSIPSTPVGLLSREVVPGLGRAARVNEIYMVMSAYGAVTNTSTGTYTAPYINTALYVETYLPAGFAGVDLINTTGGLSPALASAYSLITYGGRNNIYSGALNIIDLPQVGPGGIFPGPPTTNSAPLFRTNSPPGTTNSYWQDTVLQNDQGIDFLGNPNNLPDPDQARAAIYHNYPPNTAYFAANGVYPGNGPLPSTLVTAAPMLLMGPLTSSSTDGKLAWYPGQYRTVENQYPTSRYFMTNANLGTTLHISGGLIVAASTRSGDGDTDPTPFDAAVKGNPEAAPTQGETCDYDGGLYTNDSTSVWAALMPAHTNQTTYPTNPTETVVAHLVNGSIPVNLSLVVPAEVVNASPTGYQVTYDASVADPLVNKFPADWVIGTTPTMGNGSSAPTMTGTAGGYSLYYNADGGQNVTTVTEAQSTPYGTASSYFDPDSFWMPTLYSLIPRSARFPNIGFLNYMRTGVIPDDETVPIAQQHGTPYRCLNFNSASDASQTLSVAGTTKTTYPDWAMLDLFTVPSTLMPYGGPYGYYLGGLWNSGHTLQGNPAVMYNYGTWGGSTPGRINPNGCVIYTTNTTTPVPGITRTLPLQALLYGLTNNATISAGQSSSTATTGMPTFSGGTAVNASSVASAIATYISSNGPLREPAELCNIPAISSLYPNDTTHYNPTRNDLIRQIIGNVTTQSNTFSVWVEGESISKAKTNTNYGIYESGDQILSTVRYHFIVERDLDPGAAGIIGNPQDPAPHATYVGNASTLTNEVVDADGIVGTYDDPADKAYHPINPRYLYRVVYAEEIRD